MCRLCTAASSIGFDAIFQKDIELLELTKGKEPSNPSCFTNIQNWQNSSFSSALFEPLMPFASPQNYYQPLFVDGQKVRSDWASGWTRSLSFLSDGLLLYTKATQRQPFSQDEFFLFFFLVKFPYSSLRITNEPPRFILRAEEVELNGTNLITNQPTSHRFSFTFSHIATDKNAVRSQAVSQSKFVREVVHRKPSKEAYIPKSEFEKFTVTTYYFAPHPLLMKMHRELGYEQRFQLQNDVPKFLEEHFSKREPTNI